MKIVLLRHGQIPSNAKRKYCGSRTDEPLSEEGRSQAANCKAPSANVVYASPLIRCLQTAKIIYPELEPALIDGFKEMDFGIFEGKSADEMEDFAPYRAWVDSWCNDPIPEGESKDEFSKRCSEAFKDVVCAYSSNQDATSNYGIESDCNTGTDCDTATDSSTETYSSKNPVLNAALADNAIANAIEVTIAVVAHGGTVMSILDAYSDDGGSYYDYHIGNCGWFECECRIDEAGKPVLHIVDSFKGF